MNAKAIGEQAADIMTREVDWPQDDSWKNLLSGYIKIDPENPQATIEDIIGMADQTLVMNKDRLFMVDERRAAKAGNDRTLVNAIDDARQWLADLNSVIKDPEFEAGVRAWVMDYIAD